MADGKFEKVTRSDKALYGARKLLICGFDAGAQAKFMRLLETAGIQDIPVVWAASDQADTRLSDLMALPGDTGGGLASTLPRAIVVSGITENELHRLMNAFRQDRDEAGFVGRPDPHLGNLVGQGPAGRAQRRAPGHAAEKNSIEYGLAPTDRSGPVNGAPGLSYQRKAQPQGLAALRVVEEAFGQGIFVLDVEIQVQVVF